MAAFIGEAATAGANAPTTSGRRNHTKRLSRGSTLRWEHLSSMKKAMTTKSKRIGRKNAQNPEVDMKTAKTLRTVGENEAFHFYETIGKPTGQSARNLTDFLDKVKSAKQESRVFHLQRRDFQNWVEKSLGDSELARKLGNMDSLDSTDIRMSICKAVKNRIKELREAPAQIIIDEELVVPQC
jgi:hypothetical protein